MTTTNLAMSVPAAVAVLAALIALAMPGRPGVAAATAAPAAILASGLILAANANHATSVGPLRADALTAWMLLAIGAVGTLAGCAAPSYLRGEGRRERRRYLALTQLFLACMCVAVLADNLGLLWVAVEATTIVTAFLVGHRRTRQSMEAAWKYVVLCSIGVAIAFLGTVCVYAASVAAGSHGATALNWTHLNASAATLDPSLTRLAAGLILLGFGTKAGLAPMHAWLPDAHSQAPAPVSALMSGVLLSVAFYGILRYKSITDQVLGPGYTRTLLLIGALASLAVASALLIAQRDYKRLLAYSSIEHMGLIALGTAFGSRPAVAGALLHILGHGLAKSVAFCASGQVLRVTGSADIAFVRGLAARRPALAATFGLSLVALLGLPPFSLFASELAVARAGFAQAQGWAVTAAFLLLLLAFAAIARHATGMLTSQPAPPSPTATADSTGTLAALALGLAAAAALGITLGPLARVLDAAAAIVTGGH